MNFIFLFGNENVNSNSYIPNNTFRISQRVTTIKYFRNGARTRIRTNRTLGFNEFLVNTYNIFKLFFDNKDFFLILLSIIKSDKLIIFIQNLRGDNK